MPARTEGPLKRSLTDADIDTVVNALAPIDPAATKRDVKRLCGSLLAYESILNRADSREQFEHLSKVQKNLSSLIRLLERSDPNIQHVLSQLLTQPLARDLGDHGIEALVPEVGCLQPRLSRNDLPKSRRYNFRVVVDRSKVERIVEDHGVTMLVRLIEDIKQPITDLLDARPPGRPGPKAKPLRTHLIRRAASIFFEATGERPPKYMHGRFKYFCANLMEMIGLDTVGLIDAIKNHTPELGA